MKSIFSADVFKCYIRFIGIYALVCFIYNQQIPVHICDFF